MKPDSIFNKPNKLSLRQDKQFFVFEKTQKNKLRFEKCIEYKENRFGMELKKETDKDCSQEIVDYLEGKGLEVV